MARLYLEQAGFDDVPAARVLASDPEWLLKIAAVVVLRNLVRLERSNVKDCAKTLVDIASGGVRADITGGTDDTDPLGVVIERLEAMGQAVAE